MKLLVVGGVAGGASAAAKARRIDENAEIILFERGEYISFANCGLPYHIGGTIPEREALLVMTPERFRGRTAVDVRTHSEVVSIDPAARQVSVRDNRKGRTYTETYDKLILAPGSSPVRPSLPGIDDPDVMVLWTLPDMDRIKQRLDAGVKSAVVVGGGFIGVEVAENLRERGVEVTLVEMLPQLLPPMDPEMTKPLVEQLVEHGVRIRLNAAVTTFERRRDKNDKHESPVLTVRLRNGEGIDTGLVIMAVGVRPNSELARDAGLDVGEMGGIHVDEYLRTSNPDIFAVGDAIEVEHPVLKTRTRIPLAGPANKQGRIAAINAFGGREKYAGTLGTSICKVFDLAAASVGANEKQLKRAERKYRKLYINPASHASYYPGGDIMTIKVLFADDGHLLGAQAVGADGIDKRIDLLAMALRAGITVQQLEEMELAYAPPYGSAKDAINFVGYVAHNILKGETDMVYPDGIAPDDVLLDIRQEEEFACGSIPRSIHIPMGDLRGRMDELPKDRRVVVVCRQGARAYVAERMLKANGFNAATLAGGYIGWSLFQPPQLEPADVVPHTARTEVTAGTKDEANAAMELNACGLQCPGPIVAVKQRLDTMSQGQVLRVTASDAGFYKDLPAWCTSTGNQLLDLRKEDGNVIGLVRKTAPAAGAAMPAVTGGPKRTTIVLFSNDLDKAMAAFIIATGFRSLGHEVSIFFTFWGLNVLRRDNPPPVKKDFLSRMFGMMMPRGAKKLALSKMHMAGMGTEMMKYVMRSKNVDSLPVLIQQARKMGVRFLACEMAMNVMGIQLEELLEGVETAGVANFASLSEQSSATLFI